MKAEIKNISRLGLVFLLAFITLGIILPPTDALSDTENLKASIAAQLQEYINSSNTAPLALHQIGGIEWNLICVSGYYESGLETAERLLRPERIDFSKFSITDEYFSDAETGLVFINKKEKILITVPFDPNHVSNDLPRNPAESKGVSALIQAEKAYLIKDIVNHNRHYLRLTGTPPQQ